MVSDACIKVVVQKLKEEDLPRAFSALFLLLIISV